MTKLDEIENQRKAALAEVDKEYYNPYSPNYYDNERYRWAVSAINAKIAEAIEDLRRDSLNPYITKEEQS